MECSVAAVISAAGSSQRMGGLKKEYCPLGPEFTHPSGWPLTVLGAAVLAFVGSLRIRTVVIVVPPDAETGEFAARSSLPPELLQPGAFPRIFFVPGGKTRRMSVHHALALLSTVPD
ncbi:MAG: 2-C-methyl-D-erythritol 4-phosphate cytidylyltransferase, partial [Spirochaetaceae bacterium]|nr:2-C-methyl-D-erythritol 4-phosphate cytidylyltransferase [Spirochaetaceae bacterium]